MIEYKDGKEYWDGHECDENFIYRTLADMYPNDYERYQKESMEFNKNHIVISCPVCFYKWLADDNEIYCPSCKKLISIKDNRL